MARWGEVWRSGEDSEWCQVLVSCWQRRGEKSARMQRRARTIASSTGRRWPLHACSGRSSAQRRPVCPQRSAALPRGAGEWEPGRRQDSRWYGLAWPPIHCTSRPSQSTPLPLTYSLVCFCSPSLTHSPLSAPTSCLALRAESGWSSWSPCAPHCPRSLVSFQTRAHIQSTSCRSPCALVATARDGSDGYSPPPLPAAPAAESRALSTPSTSCPCTATPIYPLPLNSRRQ